MVVLGPTASGKTDLGIFLVKKFNGEVISADSRQVYKKMNIGTAKPRGEWRNTPPRSSPQRGEDGQHPLATPLRGGTCGNDGGAYFVDGVPHYLIDIVEPDEPFFLADFKKLAEEKIVDILSRGKLPIIVGGAGLYIWALVDNLDIPAVAPDEGLRAELEKKSPEERAEALKKIDPKTAGRIDLKNPRRVLRALEVCLGSGGSFFEQRKKARPKYDVLQIGINWPREELYERINKRVDRQIEDGLVEEVRNLVESLRDSSTALPRSSARNDKIVDSRFRGNDNGGDGGDIWKLPSMSGIGYRQIGYYLRGEMDLPEAIETLKKDTRHYAKRQMTWFKRDGRIKWIEKTDNRKVEKLVRDFFKQ